MTDILFVLVVPCLVGAAYSATWVAMSRRYGSGGGSLTTMAVIVVAVAVYMFASWPSGAAGLPAVPAVLAASVTLKRAAARKATTRDQVLTATITFAIVAVVAFVSLAAYLVLS